jgi:gluconokinase
LLRSQFETLQPLEPDERGVVFGVTEPVNAIVDAFVADGPHGS